MSKQCIWKKVVSCALTNSIDRRSGTFLPDIEKQLEESTVRFIIRHEGMYDGDAHRLYDECRVRAAAQRRADGATPFWVPLLMITGILTVIVNGISFFAAHFNPFFLLFILIGFSIYRTGAAFLAATAPERKAASIWQEYLCSGMNTPMDDTLLQMEAIFADPSARKKPC